MFKYNFIFSYYNMNGLFHPSALEVFCGPMKSGKSKEMISRVEKLDYVSNVNYKIFKPSTDKDIRNFFSRRGIEMPICYVDNPSQIIEEIKYDDVGVIGIDEAQFFDNSIIDVIKELQSKQHNIIISALDLDFRGEPFGSIPQVLSMADFVGKCSAVCVYKGCNGYATRTQKLIDGKPAPYDSPVVDPGAKYEPRCLKHHYVPR